jgi:cell division protein FtsW
VQKKSPDLILLGSVVLLLSVGVGAVYSASTALAEERFGSSAFFLERHLIRVVLALALIGVGACVDYNVWRRLGCRLALASTILVVTITAALPSSAVGHSRRFLAIGSFSSEPLELLRLLSVVYLASLLSSRGLRIRRLRTGFVEPLAWWVLGLGALMLQSSAGMAVAFSIVWLVMLFLGEARLSHVVGTATLGVSAFVLFCWLSPYHHERLDAFMFGRGDEQGIKYHPHQSKVALGAGGLVGVGLGRGTRKFWYLPHPHTDFVFSSIGEEGGFLASAALLGLFAVFGWRGLRSAARAPDPFGYYLGCGMVALILVLAALHISVCTGLAPVSGLPLPFVSFGGSSLLANAVAAGVLLSISRCSSCSEEAVP